MIRDLFDWGLALAHDWQLDYSERRLALTVIMVSPVVLAACLVARWLRR